MLFFTIKLLKNIRVAVAGRKYPHQLAWAVAFGVLLGIVPHGNLLALATLIVVLALRINHAMVAVSAIGATFLATRLDPYSDRVGQYVLSHEKLGPIMADAWRLPLVPWTDLNNTVVMGSFLIGVAALIPIFMVSYPLFRVFAPAAEGAEEATGEAVAESKPVFYVDQGHDGAFASHFVDHPAPVKERAGTTKARSSTADLSREDSVDRYLSSLNQQDLSPDQAAETTAEPENHLSFETRIDVIRMKDGRDANATVDAEESGSPYKVTTSDKVSNTEKPLDEALNYLLRQLRDSQQRKAG